MLRFAITLAVGLVSMQSVALGAEEFRRLSGREIAARFSEMEFTDEVHWAFAFDKGGRLDVVSMGKASAGS